MAARGSSTRRLLVLPVVIVVVVIALLHVFRAASPRQAPADPAMTVDGLPQLAGEVVRCEREEEGLARQARDSLDPRVSSAMVLSCPAAFDGQQVRYVGEAVGDLLVREAGAWLTVNDDAYALEVGPLGGHGDLRGTNSGLTVWLPDPLPEVVTGLGGPGRRGDVLDIRGTVLRTDPTDGGGLTLRARRVTVLAPAIAADEPADPPQAGLAAGAVLVASLMTLLRRRDRRRRERTIA